MVSKTLRTFAEDLAALGNLRASSRLRSLAKSLHPATRPAERLHRGPATGTPTTGTRDKQIAASVLSYHRQGPLLREGQERAKGEERACERRTEREKRGRNRQRERREKNNFHHLKNLKRNDQPQHYGKSRQPEPLRGFVVQTANSPTAIATTPGMTSSMASSMAAVQPRQSCAFYSATTMAEKGVVTDQPLHISALISLFGQRTSIIMLKEWRKKHGDWGKNRIFANKNRELWQRQETEDCP